MDKSLAQGWKFQKKISEGMRGLFFYQPPLWDFRTVYSYAESVKLINEGYSMETSDMGVKALQILWRIYQKS